MSPVSRIKKFFRHSGILIARIVVFLILFLVLGAGTVFVTFKTMVTPESLKAVIVSQLQDIFHRPVQIGDVRILLHQGIRVRDLKVLEASGYPGREFIFSDVVVAKYRWRALLRRRLEINEVRLVNPRIEIIRGADGVWNVEGVFVASAAPRAIPLMGFFLLPVTMAVDEISIDHGDIAIMDLAQETNYTVSDLTLQVDDFDSRDSFGFVASFESSIGLGGPWPLKARLGLRGSMSLADLHWEDASLSAQSLQIHVDDQSVFGSASIRNFRRPEITLRAKLPKLTSALLTRYGKVPQDLALPASQWRARLRVPEPRHYRLESLDGFSGRLKINASGLLDASQWPPRFQMAVSVPPTSLDRLSDVWQNWAKHRLSGMGSGKMTFSGTFSGSSSVVSIDDMYLKVDQLSGVLFDNQSLSKVDAEVRGSDNLDTVSLTVRRGGAVAYKNVLSDIDLAVRIQSPNLGLDHLHFTWGESRVKLKGSVKNLASPKDVVLDVSVDKLKLDETTAAVARVIEQINPKSFQKPKRGPWSRIFKYSIPKEFPATAGRLRIGELLHPNFSASKLALLWNVRGISPGLRRATGNIRLGVGQGRVTDIPKLKEEYRIFRFVFLPFEKMHYYNKVADWSLATAELKDMDFKRADGDYGLKNGVVDVRLSYVESLAVLAFADGVLDFPKEKIGLHFLARMTNSPRSGSVAGSLTDENGRPALDFFVEGDLNRPSPPRFNSDHKMQGDAIEKALQKGSQRSRGVFPNFDSLK